MTFRIGSFNCLNFSRSLIEKASVIAKIIISEKFDIVALQEIKSQAALDHILDKLNSGRRRLKTKDSKKSHLVWQGAFDNDNNAKDYAFIWNSKRVELANTKLSNGDIRQFHPHVYKQYRIDKSKGQSRLIRDPFYARFHTCVPGMPKIELRILNTHIRYSKDSNTDISETMTRRNEFSVLTKSIFLHISDRCYGAQQISGSAITSYTVLMGDYNLNLLESSAGSPSLLPEEEIIEMKNPHRENGDRRIITVQAERTTLKTFDSTKPRSASDEIYASNYDHFTYDANRFNGTGIACERVNTVFSFCNDDPEAYRKTVSDHVPIKMSLRIKKGQ